MDLLDTGSFTLYESTFLFSWYWVVVELSCGEVGCCAALRRGDGGCQDDD